MAITSNLYPPIVQDILPAFIRTGPCKINFSLSAYNSASDIQNVQVSLINQRTNASILKTDKYPSGIKITNLELDIDAKDDYNYYIVIDPADLIDNAFEINQFYKVQLRFTSNAAATPPSDGPELAQWLYDNMQYFSEWSRVCLIKGIEQPKITIYGFDDTDYNQQEMILTNSMFNIVGKLYYEQNDLIENEYLKSYNIKIYQSNDLNTVLVDSGDIYTDPYNPNQFNYEIKYGLIDGASYIVTFTYTTNNLYTETLEYNFTVIQHGIERLEAAIQAIPDQENGRIKIHITSTNDDLSFLGNLTIRRASSKTNFHIWEDVKTISYMTGTVLDYTWYDMTVESGIWYKYCVQKRNTYGNRGVIVQIDTPVMCLFDDIFLTGENGHQLKIQFNPTLNEFKYNITESQQTAIGSKFPYVKRNGANFFRTFPIGGLISCLSDTTDWYDIGIYDSHTEDSYNDNTPSSFTSKSEIYESSESLYNNYNIENNITDYNDYIYEREFRNKVYDFLYQNNVKLFRSTTQGNILIKLMNLDFQPMQTLGRRIYSFTATAVEIDQANITNYDKYKIQTIGNYEKYISYKHNILGQISGSYYKTDGNILISKIDPKYKKSANKGFINKINNLKWLRIEITSTPYVIVQNNGNLIKASKKTDTSDATVGYIITVNGKDIIVNPGMERQATNPGSVTQPSISIIHTGVFELKGDHIQITDLQFKYGTTATIDYIAELEEIEDTSTIAKKIYYYHKAGQLYNSFYPWDAPIGKIYDKYLINYKKYYQRLLDVTGVQIEGQPGAVLYIKDSKDINFNRHILENGYLQLMDDDINIEGLYFCGIHLKERTDPYNNVSQIRKNEFIRINNPDSIDGNGSYTYFSDITNPIPHGVYKVTQPVVNNGISFDETSGIAIVYASSVIEKVNKDYTLILQQLYENSDNNFIYYNNHWWTFTANNDVLCPVDGIINYYCEVMKGVY